MVSIKEVAKHAGVAISTVSKVLNGYPNISEDTNTKVNAAIKELNYIPNSIAAALSSKQFGRIALILDPKRQTQAIDQIFMQYLLGALDKAKELNLEVVTIFTSMIAGMDAEEITRYFLSQSITGLVIYGMSKEDKVKAIQFLNHAGAFLITKSGDKISKFFGISKYTLYSYIDEAKG